MTRMPSCHRERQKTSWTKVRGGFSFAGFRLRDGVADHGLKHAGVHAAGGGVQVKHSYKTRFTLESEAGPARAEFR